MHADSHPWTQSSPGLADRQAYSGCRKGVPSPRQTNRSRTVEVASERRLSGERLALQLGCAGRDMRVRVGAASRDELILQGQGDVHISGAELQRSGAPVVILALPVFTALGDGLEGGTVQQHQGLRDRSQPFTSPCGARNSSWTGSACRRSAIPPLDATGW